MAFQNNLVDGMVNAQKQMFDTIAENTRKFTKGNDLLNETIEKGNDWYKKWLDTQKSVFDKTTGKAAAATETVKENTDKMNEFYENWFNTQMNWAKQIWEMNQDWAKNFANNASANTNPFASFQNNMNNWAGQWNTWMSNMQNMNPAANWVNNMQNMNPLNAESLKGATDNWMNIANQYSNMLNNSFAQWQKSFESTTVQDAYKNMVNIGDGFAKFAELWMPMFKSMQDKTFNMDMYKQWMNPEMYKDLMDKYFGFLPEANRQYMQNFTTMMGDAAKQMSQAGMGSYQQMRNMMGNQAGTQVFGNMLSAYNTWNSMMNEAAAPFTKMMTQNDQTRAAQAWNDIANRIMVYNIKNAELQYMIYTQGAKVMDALAENTAKKIQDGKEVTSMLALYQEWLNISDKVYVSLFESDEYSQLMSEVSAMQMKLKKDIELQVEKMMAGIPVATRSEVDELYKAIYDLKKQVRQMEKMMEFEHEETEAPAPKAAKKAGKK